MIMVSLISVCISWLQNRLGPPAVSRGFNRPLPSVMHQTIGEEFLKNFKEIFVIGDVHGCYDELIDLLGQAGVTDDSTLKIFVGDIVNKGPKSCEVLQFVKTSRSMLSVRGNHEEIVLQEYFSLHNTDYCLRPGNGWIYDLSNDDVNFLNDLPYTITIPSLEAIIVHGGLVPGIPLECNNPHDLVSMRNLINHGYFQGGLKPSKFLDEGQSWASLWKGPYHVYFGHDAQRSLQLEAHATGLDTGCLYGQFLTGLFISGPKNGTFVKVPARKIYEVPTGKKIFKKQG